jgi:pimeloyl-ACP methyl ester carboxylesterase
MGYNFVLVHGSWHDNQAWAPVIRHLEQRGHRACAPTVAGHDKGGDKGVSHADCVKSVVDFIRQNDLRDFVLVGHSFGGTVIQPVAEQLGDRIRRLVFWNAFVLNDGESLEDNVPPHYKALFEQIAQPDGGVMLPYPIWRDAFIGDADDALAKQAYDTLSPTPRRSHTDKVPLKTFFSLQIPRSYLNCTEDIALPPGPEFGWHPRLSSRLGLYRLVQMPGSHEAIFTNPTLLADKIVEAGRD